MFERMRKVIIILWILLAHAAYLVAYREEFISFLRSLAR